LKELNVLKDENYRLNGVFQVIDELDNKSIEQKFRLDGIKQDVSIFYDRCFKKSKDKNSQTSKTVTLKKTYRF